MNRAVLFLITLFCLRSHAENVYVSPAGGSVPPYGTWTEAATNIQQAVDATAAGNTVVVADGTYVLSATVAVTNAITIRSVNGPDVTIVDGNAAVRCFDLGTNACTLSGLTIQNGYTNIQNAGIAGGAGVRCLTLDPVITNCVLTANNCVNGRGGASALGTLTDCVLTHNYGYSGASYGGRFVRCKFLYNRGVWDSVLINSLNASQFLTTLEDCLICTNHSVHGGYAINGAYLNRCIVAGNTTDYAGVACNGPSINCGYPAFINCLICDNEGTGISAASTAGILNCTVVNNTGMGVAGVCGRIVNCVVWGNEGGNLNVPDAVIASTCTSPLQNGFGNIDLDPLFAGDGDYRLPPGSPCIDFGSDDVNRWGWETCNPSTNYHYPWGESGEAWITTDLNGVPRPLGVRTDMGCCEYLGADVDTDGDGLTDEFEHRTFGTSPLNPNADGDAANDCEEYVADTDPFDADDWFRICGCNGRTVSYLSSPNRVYTLQWCLDLTDPNPYWGAVRNQVRIPGSGGIDSLIDPVDDTSCFYRVQVEQP